MRTLEETVALANDLGQLMQNPSFRKVILEAYIGDTVKEKGLGFVNDIGQVKALEAVAHLHMWIETVMNDGVEAARELELSLEKGE